MGRVYLGDEEGHRRVHPVVARVRDHRHACFGEGLFDIARDRRVEAGEHEVALERSGLGRDDFHRRNALGHLGPADPVCGLAIRPTGGALRRRERRDLELRVAVEQFDELLSDGARRAENTDS